VGEPVTGIGAQRRRQLGRAAVGAIGPVAAIALIDVDARMLAVAQLPIQAERCFLQVVGAEAQLRV